jgi:DNA-binding NarL/FixJ family response regulator
LQVDPSQPSSVLVSLQTKIGVLVNLRIFIADNESSVRQAIRLLLEHGGFSIVGEASDIENLLAQVCVSPPHLILLDWELPGLNAPRLIPTLRKYCSGTKVVALSVQPEAAQLAMAMGVDAFASKGNPPDDLLAIIHSIAREDR